MSNRYSVGGKQGEYEPGSNETVLANKAGITSPTDMDEAELELLELLYQYVLVDHLPNRQLNVQDLKDWHYWWLGNVYDWAGCERSVNLGKGDFQFASAALIPKLLGEFEVSCLHEYTPCSDLSERALIEAIAVTHVEFILIHPFREGNGRIGRLLADIMAVQGGQSPLDYSTWYRDRSQYFSAVQQGMSREYDLMESLVRAALNST